MRTPWPPLPIAVVPFAPTPIRLPAMTVSIAKAFPTSMPSEPLPEMTFPAPGSAPPMSVPLPP